MEFESVWPAPPGARPGHCRAAGADHGNTDICAPARRRRESAAGRMCDCVPTVGVTSPTLVSYLEGGTTFTPDPIVGVDPR
jgi:hypothetical protein